MTSLSENPAVLYPRKALTPNQQEALGAIAFFRYQHREGSAWRIGNKRVSATTIALLETKQLVRTKAGRIELTQAGQVASERLRGGGL